MTMLVNYYYMDKKAVKNRGSFKNAEIRYEKVKT